MPSANPDKLKLAKELARKEIVFCLARQPGGNRLFFAGSDGKVSDVDLTQDQTTTVTTSDKNPATPAKP